MTDEGCCLLQACAPCWSDTCIPSRKAAPRVPTTGEHREQGGSTASVSDRLNLLDAAVHLNYALSGLHSLQSF